MKKALIILAIITAGMAILFAQTPAESIPKEAAAAPAKTLAPVRIDEKVEQPQPAEKPARDKVVAIKETLGADEITMAVEVGEDALIEEGRISLRLKDAELKDVIRMFSALSDANIIVPDMGEEEVKRKIDVNLDNVEWQPALEAILDTHELELYEKIPASQVYAIRKKTPGAPEALEVEVFKLSYASVDSIAEIVAGLVGASGSYSVFPERNVVVVQGTAKALQRVGLIIEQIDLPRQQVFIEAKFLELSDRAQRDLGVNWEVLQAYGVQATGLGLDYQEDKTTARTDSRFTDIAGRAYENLEEAPDEWTWVNNPITGDDERYNGIDYSPRDGSTGANAERIFGIVPTASDIDNVSSLQTLTAVLGADDFRLILSALEQKDGVDLVSNPKIIVANEETANIYIGTKEPNIRQETTQVENTAPITTYKLDPDMPYFEYGIRLDVTPTVNTSSNIAVQISPSIKRFVRDKFAGNNTYPVTTEKTINTLFSLESGQTAAIGGLTETEERQKENKIPFLGDIPLLGRIFSYKQTILDQNETIIFVTVGLANPSSIDMDTGLPTNTRLAQRYTIREAADLRIAREKENLLRTKEDIEMQKELKDLREANLKLIEKQALMEKEAAEKKAKEAAQEKAKADLSAMVLAKDAAVAQKIAEESAADLSVETLVEDVESTGGPSSSAADEAKAGQAERADPVAEVIAPVNSSAATLAKEKAPTQEDAKQATPVATALSVEEMLGALKSASKESGGGTVKTNSTRLE